MISKTGIYRWLVFSLTLVQIDRIRLEMLPLVSLLYSAAYFFLGYALGGSLVTPKKSEGLGWETGVFPHEGQIVLNPITGKRSRCFRGKWVEIDEDVEGAKKGAAGED